MDFVDEIVHINIHKDEIRLESEEVQKFINDNASMEFYPGGLKHGKEFDKVAEFKRVLKELEKVRKENDGAESNEEGIVYQQLLELLDRMMIHHLRELNLEKLI